MGRVMTIKTAMYVILAISVMAVTGSLNVIYMGNNQMNLVIAIVVSVSGLLPVVWMRMESRKENRRIEG